MQLKREAPDPKLQYPNFRLPTLRSRPSLHFEARDCCSLSSLLTAANPSVAEMLDLEFFKTLPHLPEWTREVGWLQFVTRYFPRRI